MKFKKGQLVYYVGSNQNLQHDYGKQELTVLGVDSKSKRLVCAAADGRCLVGLSSLDVQSAEDSALKLEQKMS
jgi:hypothetical protein